MSDDPSERFFRWMEENAISRSEGAAMLKVDERSLSNYRSRGLPQKKFALAERLMSEPYTSARTPAEENKLNITFTDKEFDLVQEAATIVQTRIKDFIIRATISKAREEIQRGRGLKVAEDPPTYIAPAAPGSGAK